MSVSFSSTYKQFIQELTETFPEYAAPLTLALESPDLQTVFLNTWKTYTKDVAGQNGAIFTDKGLELVPGLFMTSKLWSELSSGTQAAIWKYISSLLLLTAASSESAEGLWDLSGFQVDMEEMMAKLKEAGACAEAGAGDDAGLGGLGGMADIFEKLGKMAGTFGMPDLSGFAGAFGDAGKFKIPERLFKGHIAKIAEELVKEFKPEDFGISPDMLESDDPARIFNYLQEIFTKKPEMLMTAAQKIAKKIQAKFQRGEIKREDIIREAEELMAEFSENEAFSSLFGSLGEMMKTGEKESGNEGSARRREVQERLRRKQSEKDAKKTSNIVVQSADASAQYAAAAAAADALLAEEDEATARKPTTGNKKRK